MSSKGTLKKGHPHGRVGFGLGGQEQLVTGEDAGVDGAREATRSLAQVNPSGSFQGEMVEEQQCNAWSMGESQGSGPTLRWSLFLCNITTDPWPPIQKTAKGTRERCPASSCSCFPIASRCRVAPGAAAAAGGRGGGTKLFQSRRTLGGGGGVPGVDASPFWG